MKLTEPMDAFSVQESFSDYLQKVYKEPPKDGQKAELKMAFYAGAYHVRSGLEVARTLHPVMAKTIVTKMDDELIDYLKDLVDQGAPEAGKNGTEAPKDSLTSPP